MRDQLVHYVMRARSDARERWPRVAVACPGRGTGRRQYIGSYGQCRGKLRLYIITRPVGVRQEELGLY